MLGTLPVHIADLGDRIRLLVSLSVKYANFVSVAVAHCYHPANRSLATAPAIRVSYGTIHNTCIHSIKS
jgi:hypothetical protein